MKYYFHLQLLRFHRLLRASGFHPVPAYVLLMAIFIVASQLIVNSIERGSWIYTLLAIYLFLKTQNNKFSSLIFSKHQLRKLHLFEGAVFSVPFFVMLSLSQFFLEGVILIFSILISTRFSINTQLSIAVPTPFYKQPFEFITGFRKTWVVVFIAYGLCSIALTVGNFNLAIFSIALVYLNLITFYAEPEPKFFVWMHSMTPKEFLLTKIKTALFFSALLTGPFIAALYLLFPENWVVTTFLFLTGPLLPTMGILNKYSYFPSRSELIQSILIGVSLLFPPLLLLIIPYLINKATTNLKDHL